MFLTSMIVSAFSIAVAIGVHEFGHAFVAYKLGDPTAKNSGRMTPNPIAHLDPFGLLMMVLVGVGFASPVPINSNNFKYKTRKRDMILVSLAGAIFNILTAILCAFIIGRISNVATRVVLTTVMTYNISFAAFNLIPIIPPLDGWQILKQLVPYKYHDYIYRYESASMYIFLIIIMTGAHRVIMAPMCDVIYSVVRMFM